MLAYQHHAMWRRLSLAAVDDIIGPGCGLIIAPHPDDESLGCGGLIAECCQAGRPPVVVFLTDGAMSHPASKNFPRERLIHVREREAIAAAASLGLATERLIFLREPDTKAPREGRELDRVVNRIARLANRFWCSCILAPWRFDPHCDHEAAARIAEKVAAARNDISHVSYPVWGWTLPPEKTVDDSGSTGWRLDISSRLDLKHRAIAAHRSQYGDLITDDPSGFHLPTELLAVFEQPFETFLRP
jgi:LmbE family N-acetylglucosaminyl deacetylase